MPDLTLMEAARTLGVDKNRMRWLLRTGRVLGRKPEYVWFVDAGSVEEARRAWEREGTPWTRRKRR